MSKIHSFRNSPHLGNESRFNFTVSQMTHNTIDGYWTMTAAAPHWVIELIKLTRNVHRLGRTTRTDHRMYHSALYLNITPTVHAQTWARWTQIKGDQLKRRCGCSFIVIRSVVTRSHVHLLCPLHQQRSYMYAVLGVLGQTAIEWNRILYEIRVET